MRWPPPQIIFTHVCVGLDAPEFSPVGNLGTPFGQAAVMVFFVVSGFVLYRPFVAARAAGRPEQPLHRFALRRVVRVIPAYWAILTVYAALGGAPQVFTDEWWRYYLLLQVYATDPIVVQGGIPPAWTLSVEMSFYLLLIGFVAIVRRLARRRPDAEGRWRLELLAPLPLVAVGVTFTLVAIYNPDWAMAARTLPGTIHTFAIGMLLAVVSVRAEHGWALPRALAAIRDHSTACVVVVVACLVAIYRAQLFPTPENPTHVFDLDTYAACVGAATVIAFALVAPVTLGAVQSAPLMRLLGSRVLVWLGIVSYGTYLAHWQLVTWLEDPLQFAPLVPHLLVLLAAVYGGAVVIGALSWYRIERPTMRAVSAGRRRRRGRGSVDRTTAVRSPA